MRGRECLMLIQYPELLLFLFLGIFFLDRLLYSSTTFIHLFIYVLGFAIFREGHWAGTG